MGTLRISYYAGVEKYVAASPIKQEKITTSASHAESDNFPSNTTLIVVSTDANVVCCIGISPVAADDATAGQFYVPIGERPVHIGPSNVSTPRKLSALTV